MSDWLRLVNEIKRYAPPDLFTPGQRQACDRLKQHLRFPERVNLYGPAGSGKTFVAWGLAREIGAIHLPSAKALTADIFGTRTVVVDSLLHYEDVIRNILAQCNLLDVTSVVVITRQPVAMPMIRVELPLPTPADVEQIRNQIERIGFYGRSQVATPVNLWNILQACL